MRFNRHPHDDRTIYQFKTNKSTAFLCTHVMTCVVCATIVSSATESSTFICTTTIFGPRGHPHISVIRGNIHIGVMYKRAYIDHSIQHTNLRYAQTQSHIKHPHTCKHRRHLRSHIHIKRLLKKLISNI